MTQSRKLIVANWKMNELRVEAEDLATSVARQAGHQDANADIVICPPFTLLTIVGQDIAGSNVKLGGQDCHPEDKGAFTGDISARMLRDVGAQYVIVGHSERRSHYLESSQFVALKAAAALRVGLIPIICVGESLEVRESGHANQHVSAELDVSLPQLSDTDRIVVAYEPLWAIGSGQTCSDEDIASMHGALRQTLRHRSEAAAISPIIYGGSVKAENARRILALPDVDGALVGGASLDSKSFLAIVAAAKNEVGPHA